MTIELTKGALTALARIDTSGMKHAEKLNAFAKVFGFRTQAAMMAALKKQKGAAQEHLGNLKTGQLGGHEAWEKAYSDVPAVDQDVKHVAKFLKSLSLGKDFDTFTIVHESLVWAAFRERADGRFSHKAFQGRNSIFDVSYDAWWVDSVRSHSAFTHTAWQVKSLLSGLDKMLKPLAGGNSRDFFPWILDVSRVKDIDPMLYALLPPALQYDLQTGDALIEQGLKNLRSKEQVKIEFMDVMNVHTSLESGLTQMYVDIKEERDGFFKR